METQVLDQSGLSAIVWTLVWAGLAATFACILIDAFIHRHDDPDDRNPF